MVPIPGSEIWLPSAQIRADKSLLRHHREPNAAATAFNMANFQTLDFKAFFRVERNITDIIGRWVGVWKCGSSVDGGLHASVELSAAVNECEVSETRFAIALTAVRRACWKIFNCTLRSARQRCLVNAHLAG
jgi:hypothetical protein